MAMKEKERVLLEEELQTQNVLNSKQIYKSQIQNKHKYTPFARYCVNQYNDLKEEDECFERESNAALNELQLKKTEELAIEMNKMKTEATRDERLRQLIRETSPELRELEAKLKAAYNCKIIRAQIQEKEADKLREKLREKQAQELLLKARIEDKEYKRMLKEEEIKQKYKYKLELQDQMILRERNKRFQYEEFLREKKVIDDLIQRMHEENERELELKYCKKIKTLEEIKAFKEAKEIWKAKARKQIKEEDIKIKEFMREKVELERQRKSDKEQQEAIRAQICDNLAKKIYQEKRQRDERDKIIMELKIEEKREAFEREEKTKLEKEIRRRIEINSSLNSQMKERLDRLKREAEEDAAYKEQLIVKIAEDERLEQLTKEKKRLKMLTIRKDVEEMMRHKRQQKAEEMQELIKIQENEKEELEKRRQIIEEERLKMLREHAINLIGCIPPGVLRDDDFDKLNIDGEFSKKIYCKDY